MGKPKGGSPDKRVETTGEGWPEQMEEHTSLAAHTVTILEAIRDTKTSLEMQIAAESVVINIAHNMFSSCSWPKVDREQYGTNTR
ncbi:hypothetical protein NDU88_008425 [Pleurodeles waltl]|uniref:Uncharacterized protein n=1 Tax=Pleurodeles waltl TaxID=8319 RepID=A0AAV7SV73_PLEWA|nr:hypothetical protein NDU88_008424 [Pleurodeles waltl]KAJ1168043.1 hypothetical protein NDU88_008425 [Pleurodeles waltl]